MEVFGYETKTTFWEDFSTAELSGIEAITDAYNKAFNKYKNNVVFLTELVMVLNWKIWSWYGVDDEIGRLYDSIWRIADRYAIDNLKGKDLAYFLETTD